MCPDSSESSPSPVVLDSNGAPGPNAYLLSSYQFTLPEELIAQYPPAERTSSRLLVCSKDPSDIPPTCIHTHFTHLADYLPQGALLVANNSRVLEARLLGRRPTGGAIEFLLLTPLPLLVASAKPSPSRSEWLEAKAEGLIRSNARIRPGDSFTFAPDLVVTVLASREIGLKTVTLAWKGDLQALFSRTGHVPLPPYIRRKDLPEDRERYQTVYAKSKKTGSVAAPTAGLHFTEAFRQSLLERGFQWREVTLYVGAGTFRPVRVSDIRDHKMHAEYVELSQETADAVRKAKESGRPIIAVGTTSARALEGAYQACGGIAPYSGTTDLFLYPGKQLHVIDGILTNFHLPGSTLLMLISAIAGRERILDIYKEAINEHYRFYSYGDCMLIR